jgi:hypothetical protein
MSDKQTEASSSEAVIRLKSGPASIRRWALLIAGCSLLVASGCARKATPTISKSKPGISVPVTESKVLATNTSFLFLNAKGKAQINLKGNKQSANLALRMRRDSIIWVSGSLVGIEGVRAVLTPDSVRVLNRLEKTYFSGGYDYLSKLLNVPVSFAQMQAILLGDYQPAPAGTTPKIVSEEGGHQRVSYPLADVLVERLLQAGTGRVQQLKVSDPASKRDLTVDYTDFQPLDGANGLPFAHSTLIQAQQPASGTVTAAINYTKVNVGRERLAFPFAVPKGYKRQK